MPARRRLPAHRGHQRRRAAGAHDARHRHRLERRLGAAWAPAQKAATSACDRALRLDRAVPLRGLAVPDPVPVPVLLLLVHIHGAFADRPRRAPAAPPPPPPPCAAARLRRHRRPPPAPRRRPASRPISCATTSQLSARCRCRKAASMASGPRATALAPSGPAAAGAAATTTHARPAASGTMLSCARSCATPSAAPSVRESERSAKMAPPAEGGAPPQAPRPRQRREVFEEGAVARRLPRQRLHPAPQPCRHGAQLYAAALQAQGALGGGSRGVGRPRHVAHGMLGQQHFEPHRALPRAGMAADGPCTSLCLSREAQAVQQKRAQPQLPCEGLGRQRAGARQGWARRRPSAAGGSAAAVRRSPPMPRQSSTESSVGGVSAGWFLAAGS